MTSEQQRKPVVLVVDDEAMLRMLAIDHFEDAGFEAIEAADAASAISILRSRPDIRAVFTDVQMPGELSGYDFAQLARAEIPDCAIVVVSGREIPMPGDLAVDAHFISKPYEGAEVVRLIDKLIADSHRADIS